MLVATSAFARVAAADDPPPQPPPDPDSPGSVVATSGISPKGEPTVVMPSPVEPTAAEVADAPPPGSESGRLDVEPGDSPARQIARTLLMFPKAALWVVDAPVRGSLWAYDKYELKQRYYRWFYNDARTLGIVPTGAFVSGFGVTLGAMAVERNYFGYQERADLMATFGLQGRQDHRLRLTTGNLFGDRVVGGVFGNYDARPDDKFFGLGNADTQSSSPTLIDPESVDTSVKSYYKYQEARVGIDASVHIVSDLYVTPSIAIASIKSTGSSISDPPIQQVYNPMDLVGFDQWTNHLYPALELRWDSRSRLTPWEPVDVHTTGTLISAYLGRVVQNNSLEDFWHYGGEVQQYWRIAKGPTALGARLNAEGVTGSFENVPFTEMPYLGGVYLRGYDFLRFRDRLAVFGSLQYRWDLSGYFDAYLFVDSGRVYDAPKDLTLSGLRTGFGFGLEFHLRTGFIAEASIASSVDGGAFATLSLNPISDSRPRWR